jgi:hypothetical protein
MMSPAVLRVCFARSARLSLRSGVSRSLSVSRSQLSTSARLRVGGGRGEPAAPGAAAAEAAAEAARPPPASADAEECPLDEGPIDHFDETGFTTLPSDAEAVLKRRTREELYEELCVAPTGERMARRCG